MLTSDRRRDAIRGRLAERGEVEIAALAAEFDVSEMTIRRDLETLEERGANLGPLTDEHQCFGILEPVGQGVQIVGVVVPDFNIVAGELLKTGETAQGVMIIVEY